MRLSPRHAGILLVLGAIWGASFLFLKLAVPDLGVDLTIGLRLLLGAALLSVVAWAQRAPWLSLQDLRANALHYTMLGVLNSALPFWLFAWSAQALPAGLLAIFNSTAPIWASLMAAGLGQGGLSLGRAFGLLLGVGGVATAVATATDLPMAAAVVGSWETSAFMLTALGAAMSYGSASVYAAWLGRRKQAQGEPFDAFAHAHGSMWMGGLVAAVVLLPPTLMDLQLNPISLTPMALAAAAALGLLCTGLAYLWYFRLIIELGAVSAMSVAFLIPIFGILWGVIFLGEPLTPGLLAGGAMVLLGTVLAANRTTAATTSPPHPSPRA